MGTVEEEVMVTVEEEVIETTNSVYYCASCILVLYRVKGLVGQNGERKRGRQDDLLCYLSIGS